MKNLNTENLKDTLEQTVVAIAKQCDGLSTVELQKYGQTIYISNAKTEQTDYNQLQISRGHKTVVAFDSSVVAFYRLVVPVSKHDEFEKMIVLQTEARFPLPADQTELSWLAEPPAGGQTAVTVAAARKEILESFVAAVKGINPEKIILDCQAVVGAWQRLFEGSCVNAVVIDITCNNCQICIVNRKNLVNMVNLDSGLDDLAANEHIAASFIGDIVSILNIFEAGSLPIFVLSDGNEGIEKIVSLLKDNALEASACLPEAKATNIHTELTAGQIYQYRVAIGAGLMELETQENHLNIFEKVYQPAGRKQKTDWAKSLTVTAGIAIAMFVLMVIAFFAADMTAAKIWKNSKQGDEYNQLVQRQRLIDSIVRRRIDLLELLGKINRTDSNGIEINNFSFKQGQVISIRGQAPNAEELTKFEKSIQSQSGITDVKTQNPKADEKSGKVNFTMTFQYKTFTAKKGAGIL